MSDDESKVVDIQNKYEAFYSMGHSLYNSKQFRRAVWYLTQAIDGDKEKARPLIERATCYLQLSKYEKALSDIEAAHKLDKLNPKILLLHGEIYYQKGEFEKALVIFQRGRRIRSTMYEFQLGINKCELCIKNATVAAKPKKIELNSDMDLEEFFEEAYPDLKEIRIAKKKQKEASSKKNKKVKIETAKREEDDLPNKIPPLPFNKKTIALLIEAEASDRRFMNDIYNIEDDRIGLIKSAAAAPDGLRKQKTNYSKDIQKSTIESAVYLDNHINFWYRQNPRRVTDINLSRKKLPEISRNKQSIENKNNPLDFNVSCSITKDSDNVKHDDKQVNDNVNDDIYNDDNGDSSQNDDYYITGDDTGDTGCYDDTLNDIDQLTHIQENLQVQ